MADVRKYVQRHRIPGWVFPDGDDGPAAFYADDSQGWATIMEDGGAYRVQAHRSGKSITSKNYRAVGAAVTFAMHKAKP